MHVVGKPSQPSGGRAVAPAIGPSDEPCQEWVVTVFSCDMTRLLSFGANWIFYVQVIGVNKSLCPSVETVAANSVYGTPFLAFKLGFCRHNGNLNKGRSVRRMSFCMHTEGGVPYSFTKASSPRQILAWMRLLAKVQRGELEP